MTEQEIAAEQDRQGHRLMRQAKSAWARRDEATNAIAKERFGLDLPMHLQFEDAGEVFNLNVYATLTRVKMEGESE